MSKLLVATFAVATTTAALAPVANAAPAPLRPVTHTTILGGASPAGDVNGDGLEDLVSSAGCAATVIFGAATPATIDPANPGARGFKVTSGASDCGGSWSSVGDTNGDGRDDLVSRRADRAIWVVYGRATTTTVDLNTLGTGGLRLFTTASGVNPTLALSASKAVGDVNGDGRADIGIEGRVREPGVAEARPAIGVVYSPASGGSLDVGKATTPGLIIANTNRADGQPQPYELSRIGDVNRDGREDLLFSVARPVVDGSRIVLGRAASGLVDLSRDASITVNWGTMAPLGDLNGDGLQEQADQPGLLLTSTASPYLRFDDASRRLRFTASYGSANGVRAPAAQLAGDSAPDLVTSASFGVSVSTSHLYFSDSAHVHYLHSGSTAGTFDLRTTARRVDGLPRNVNIDAVARFSHRATSNVLLSEAGKTVVASLEPAPADTTPPVLDQVRWDKSSISRSCSADCAGAESSHLLYRLNEPAWIEFTLKRGTTVVGTGQGAVEAVTDDPWASFKLSAVLETGGCGYLGCTIGYQRLPAGTYTATLRAKDRSDNVSATRTATIVVQ